MFVMEATDASPDVQVTALGITGFPLLSAHRATNTQVCPIAPDMDVGTKVRVVIVAGLMVIVEVACTIGPPCTLGAVTTKLACPALVATTCSADALAFALLRLRVPGIPRTPHWKLTVEDVIELFWLSNAEALQVCCWPICMEESGQEI
jgi:hypothetical protein